MKVTFNKHIYICSLPPRAPSTRLAEGWGPRPLITLPSLSVLPTSLVVNALCPCDDILNTCDHYAVKVKLTIECPVSVNSDNQSKPRVKWGNTKTDIIKRVYTVPVDEYISGVRSNTEYGTTVLVSKWIPLLTT